MNRRELVLALSERLETDRRTADAALGTVIEVITETVAKGEPVAISGFAKFARRDLPARTVRNNFTGEMVKRPASKKVRITPLKAFKDAAISGKVVKKAAAKKTTAKKAATGRVTGTTARARVSTSGGTTTARKTTAKKAPARKTTAKRASAKKAPARKTAAKRARCFGGSFLSRFSSVWRSNATAPDHTQKRAGPRIPGAPTCPDPTGGCGRWTRSRPRSTFRGNLV